MSDLQNLVKQRQMVAAILLGADNYQEVIQICATTKGDLEAVTRVVMGKFGITEFEAHVILDMQIKKFTPAAIALVRSELVAIDARLNALEN